MPASKKKTRSKSKGKKKVPRKSKGKKKTQSKSKSKKKTKSKSKVKHRCPSGKVIKKSHSRKGYTRADGTRVSKGNVKYGCVNDKGKKGKTYKNAKILPKLKEDVKLGTFGYYLDRAETKRREALRKASKKHGALKVLRRLNLIRNYTGDKNNKAKLSADVKYMKDLYAKVKKNTKSKSKSKSKK